MQASKAQGFLSETQADIRVLTVTFHSLVYQPVQEGPTVVTEGGA